MIKRLLGIAIAVVMIVSLTAVVFAGGHGGSAEPIMGIIPIECPEDDQGQDDDD